MTLLDLKDAYLYMPIHHSQVSSVCSQEEGDLIVYQWNVLPFDLATASRVFTKLMPPVAAHLHLQECLMYPYMDGICHAQAPQHQMCQTHDFSLRSHFFLEFVINLMKSALIPSHLGALNVRAGAASVPPGQVGESSSG